MAESSAAAGRPELVSAMLDPGLYRHSPSRVELRETHTSWVFLAGELAYKVKKPVTVPFLDYGMLERRREMCREEVRLNRRLAPEIYLGVVGIAGEGDRHMLTAEDDAAAIEYAVEMRRVEEERSLEALLAGKVEEGQVAAVAQRLASFHAGAEISPPPFREIGPLVESLEENLATLREAGGEILDRDRVRAAERFTRSFLAARWETLEERSRGGLVRECHGDLRAEHVIVPAQGEVYVYDCVEFNPALRHIDVASDLSFLVMDVTRLGGGDLAARLSAEYRRAGGDPGDDPLLSFFASFRAGVRAKVALLRAGELPPDDPERGRSEGEARELLALGHRFAWGARGPLVLIVCGVAGTGKTTLARELAGASGWPHLSSDLTRKRLAGLDPTERPSPEHYSAEFTERTYREVGRSAREQLGRGGAIVDATFHRRAEREAFSAGLGEAPGRVLFVECRAPLEVLRDRVMERASDGWRISDADVGILERQLAELEPLEEIPAEARTELVTEAPSAELLTEVESFVDRVAFGSP